MRKIVKCLPFVLLGLIGISLGVYERYQDRISNGAGRIIDSFIPPDNAIPYHHSLAAKLDKIGWQEGSEVFIRIFKNENTLEMFGRHQGSWVLLKTWPICRWSGKLGPKFAEGDRQAPEGFYMISKKQLHPNSQHHRAFNLGFPNQVERAQGKTGSFLMVHGNCSSIGCYAMTNPGIDEIYNIVEAALEAGQKQVAVHAFPFRLTDQNLAQHKDHKAYSYWADQLKPGYDAFEQSRKVPIILACNDRYGFADDSQTPKSGCAPLRGW